MGVGGALPLEGAVFLSVNGKASFFDEEALRRAVVSHGVPYATTLSAASAAVEAIQAMRREPGAVRSLQEWHSSG